MTIIRVREAARVLADDVAIPITEFKATCLELIDAVSKRHFEVIVTKHGKPVAKLVPIEPPVQSGFGCLKGTVLDYGDIDAPLGEDWFQDKDANAEPAP